MKPAFFLSRKYFEEKSNCWKIYRLFHLFRFLSGDKFELSDFISASFSKLAFFCPANIQMKSPFAEICTLLFIFCIFIRKTFDSSRNYILRSSELLFPPFWVWVQTNSGWAILFRQGFQNCSFLSIWDSPEKSLGRNVYILFIFWTFSRKNLRIQQKKFRPERWSSFFRVHKTFVQKNISSWTTYHFSISFWLWAKKTSFFNGTISAELSKLLCLISTKNSEEISVHWKNCNFVHFFFGVLSKKKLEFSKIDSVELSKKHFWCPVKTFRNW